MTFLERFEVLDKAGEGTYGVVYRARDTATGALVAIKKVRVEHCEEGIPQTTLREISLLRELRHPHVVRLLDVSVEQRRIFLVFECAAGDLRQALERRRFQPAEARALLVQLLEGLLYCHANRVVHRDLKPQNVLLDERGAAKLADFGLARALPLPAASLTPEVVTLWYRAPELLLGERTYSPAVDIWSLGCIFAETLLGRALLPGDSEIDQLFRIFQLRGTPTPLSWPAAAALPHFRRAFPRFPPAPLALPGLAPADAALLARMLTLDPAARPSALQLLREVRSPVPCCAARRPTHLRRALSAASRRASAALSALVPPPAPPSLRSPRSSRACWAASSRSSASGGRPRAASAASVSAASAARRTRRAAPSAASAAPQCRARARAPAAARRNSAARSPITDGRRGRAVAGAARRRPRPARAGAAASVRTRGRTARHRGER